MSSNYLPPLSSSSTSTEPMSTYPPSTPTEPMYPYPEGVEVWEHVHCRLSGSNYQQWKQQMENLLRETGMVGFIDGTKKAPARKVIEYGREIENEEYEYWKKSNDLVRKWIRNTITDDIKIEVKRVWTAEGLWTRFENWYSTPTRTATAPVPPPPPPPCSAPPSPLVFCPIVYDGPHYHGHGHARARARAPARIATFPPPPPPPAFCPVSPCRPAPCSAPPSPPPPAPCSAPPSPWCARPSPPYSPSPRPPPPLSPPSPPPPPRARARAPAPAPAHAHAPAPAPAPPLAIANRLHKAAIKGDWCDWDEASKLISAAVREGITEYKETGLIVAVKSKKRNDFVKKLLEEMSQMDVALGDTRKRTALHRAAGVDNMDIAKLLVQKNRCLPNAQTLDKRIPLYFAAARGHRDMVLYLLSVTTTTRDESGPTPSYLSQWLSDKGYSENQTPIGNGTRLGIEEFRWNPTPFDGESGFRILHQLTINGFYDIALALLQDKAERACFIPAPKETQNDIELHSLVALARKSSSFKSGTSFNWLQSYIYSDVLVNLENNADHQSTGDIENPAGCFTSGGRYAKNILHWMIRKITYLSKKISHWMILTILLRCRKHIKEKKRLHDQALELVKFLCDEIANSNHSTAKKIFQLALFQATSHGIVEIVEQILRSYPNAIYLKNDNEQSIFHLAIECRHEKVFNLIHQVGEFKTIFLTQRDKLKNNALHLAGKLAPQQQLYLKAGPALQMQRELQWFKGVEKLVVPRNKEEKNIKKYTPAEVFTDTHRELVKEGENWMRGTANSCSLVATLIATVVFAAAITVPGGNDSSGHPIFSKKSIFLLFIICDALALFSSITSVLFFLSILSSHYGEEDFLVSLPRRLIFGLITLFLSILSTMIAFGAIVYLVFGESYKEWIAIPIVVLPCIPVVLFLILKSNLLLEMYNSTYHNIFLNQSDDMLY